MDQTVTPTPPLASDMAETAANRTDDALLGIRRAADQAVHSVQAGIDAGIDRLRDTVPAAVSRTTAGAEDLTRRAIERTRQAVEEMHRRASHLGDAATLRIKDQPIRAVLVAAALGAAAALLLQWWSRRPHPHAHRH